MTAEQFTHCGEIARAHEGRGIGAEMRGCPAGLTRSRMQCILQGVLGVGLIVSVMEEGSCHSAEAVPSGGLTNAIIDQSSDRRVRIRSAIAKGAEHLVRAQNPGGWWSTQDQPAVTAMALTALSLEPTGRIREGHRSELNRGYDYLLSSARPDGGIYRVGLANYNTSLALLAMSASGDPHFLPVIAKARQFIAATQNDLEKPGALDTPFDGGVGYGSKYQHSDMNNTLIALEAMRASEAALKWDTAAPPVPPADLNWKAVVNFLTHCQNLPETNPASWVSTDPKDRGGFVYYPGHSMAGAVTNAETGRVALRSYGSISYGGLLSLIYAKVAIDDPRVTAVRQWLSENYTLDENPGMGRQGYFYYLHLMVKALTAVGEDGLTLRDGRRVDWRTEVAERILSLQRPDGSWVNSEPRWWEQDAVLVSSYALLTLEMLDFAESPAASRARKP